RALAPLGVHLLCSLGLAASVLLACTAASWDRHDWLTYHVLTASVALVGAITLAASAQARRKQEIAESDPVPWWAGATVILVAALAIRGVLDDPGRPWWAAGALLASSGLSAALAIRQRKEAWALAAGLGVNLAASLATWSIYQGVPLSEWWNVLVRVNVIA